MKSNFRFRFRLLIILNRFLIYLFDSTLLNTKLEFVSVFRVFFNHNVVTLTRSLILKITPQNYQLRENQCFLHSRDHK